MRILLFGVVLFVSACGGSELQNRPLQADLFPLAVGNRWVYAETGGSNPGTVTKEIIRTEELDGQSTFVLETSQTNSSVIKRSNWIDQKDRVSRLRQERWQDNLSIGFRTYDPGFLRIDRSLRDLGTSSTEEHVRREHDASGTEIETKTKQYTWLIEAVDEEVTVAAGTFSSIRISRTDSNGGNVKRYWYAPGVGKVLEEDSKETEALIEYNVAETGEAQ